MANYYNLQIIYNFTVTTEDESKVLDRFEEAGKELELLPYFEVKEIRRQTAKETLDKP